MPSPCVPTDGSVPHDLIGGRFRTQRLLGSGAMGQVWLATDERLQRSVAVKVVSSDIVDPAQSLRLEREARAAAAVQHANVVRVFDFLDDDGRTLIVMEYVEGETLADRMERVSPFPYEDAVEVAAQLCDGLSAAHRLGLIHRDLKPANVIITNEGLAKILDFGIAKRTGHLEATLTQTGAVLGTPQYMAPEQLTGDELDARADVHAVGLVLYEMLAGRPAFGGGTIAQLMFQLVSEPPDLKVLAERNVPADVVAIIAQALKKNREDRWPDAISMAEALRVALYGDVIRSRRTPTPVGLRPATQSNPALRPVAQPRSDGLRLPPAGPERTRVMRMAGAGAVAVAIITAFVLSSSADGLPKAAAAPASPGTLAPEPSSPPTSVVSPDKALVPRTATVVTSPPRAEKEDLEAPVRAAVAEQVQSSWRLFSKPVAAEVGDRLASLRSEFVVQISPAGQLADVRPVRLSGVAVFDDNAAAAVQNVTRVRLGGARSSTGWTFRVQLSGKTVRVRNR
jgi:serine/threonine protein kinase